MGDSERVRGERVRLWVYAMRAELGDGGRYLRLETEEGVVMVRLPAEGIIEEEGARGEASR